MVPPQDHELIQKVDFAVFNRLQTSLVWIYESEVLWLNYDRESLIEEQTALYLHSGDLVFHSARERLEVQAGEWILIQPGLRRLVFTPGSRILSLHFNLSWPGGQPLYDWERPQVFKGSDAPQLYPRAKRLERLVERKFPTASTRLRGLKSDLETHLSVHHAFLGWLIVYIRELNQRGIIPSRLGKVDPRALQAVQVIDMHPFEKVFHGKELASQLGLSLSQLDRLFIKQFGLTPRHYFERRKLRAARERLIYTADPVKQIAYELGFGSISHFSTWMKRLSDFSPREMRELEGKVREK